MTVRFTRKLIPLCLLFLGGCGGGSSSSPGTPPSPPSGPGAPPSGSEFLYQFSFASATQVSTLNTATGVLSPPTEATPFADFENQRVSGVATPSGKYLYELGFYQSPPPGPPFFGTPVSAIWGYAVGGPNGTLTNVPSTPVPQNKVGLGNTPNALVMDRQGQFLFVSVYNGTNSSGQSQNSIITFAIDPTTGELTNTSTLNSTTQASVLVQAVDPTNKFLYASSALSNGLAITVYSFSSVNGALTEIQGSPFLVVSPPEGVTYNLGVVPSPDGKFVYATLTSETFTSPGIYSFAVDPLTNSLTVVQGSPFPVGNCASITFGKTGSFLFAMSPGNISGYAVNILTGTVNASSSSSTAVSSFFGDVLVDPSGQFLVFNDSFRTASTFQINGSTGALTPVNGSPFAVGTQWSSASFARIP